MGKIPKLVTPEQAVEAIKSNDDVVLANFCSEPKVSTYGPYGALIGAP